MRTQRKLKPGQPGTKKLTAQYGAQLVCVRYRYDEQQKRSFKTVELIVEEAPWEKYAGVSGYIYFIKASNGAVKIGRTTNLENRTKTFEIKLPFPISVEHHFETRNARVVEKMFHDLFAHNRLAGEWFDLPEEVLNSIKRGDFDHLVKEAEGRQDKKSL